MDFNLFGSIVQVDIEPEEEILVQRIEKELDEELILQQCQQVVIEAQTIITDSRIPWISKGKLIHVPLKEEKVVKKRRCNASQRKRKLLAMNPTFKKVKKMDLKKTIYPSR